MPEYRVSKHDVGLPIDEFLLRKIPAAPRSYLRQLIKSGKIRSCDRAIPASHITVLDENIQLPESNRLSEFISNEVRIPEVLFETREILIVNKPSGLAVHSSKGHERSNLTDLVRQKWGHKFSISPIHRLDLETSGPVLFGKGKKSCSELGKLLMAGKMRKTYLALVAGEISDQGSLSTLMPSKGKLKNAVSSYDTISANSRASLVKIDLQTGRQHQIRHQLASIGHPLFGDKRYSGPCPAQLKRLFLHCCELSFQSPFDNSTIEISTPLPSALLEFLDRLKLESE